MYVLNTSVTKFIEETLLWLRSHNDPHIVIVCYFNTFLSPKTGHQTKTKHKCLNRSRTPREIEAEIKSPY